MSRSESLDTPDQVRVESLQSPSGSVTLPSSIGSSTFDDNDQDNGVILDLGVSTNERDISVFAIGAWAASIVIPNGLMAYSNPSQLFPEPTTGYECSPSCLVAHTIDTSSPDEVLTLDQSDGSAIVQTQTSLQQGIRSRAQLAIQCSCIENGCGVTVTGTDGEGHAGVCGTHVTGQK